MHHFSSDGVDIAYVDIGQGEPILLIHGFASNHTANWRSTGWIDTLTGDGRRVVAMDVRGHGASAKLYEPEAYRPQLMAEDAANLPRHLGIPRADVMGYSMGARITAFLCVNHPARVRSAILGGLGVNLVDGHSSGLAQTIVAALEAPSLADVTHPVGRAFRSFAEQTKSDLRALAACMRRKRDPLSGEQVAGIRAPVLVAVGTNDDVAGSAHELAAIIPGARALDIPNRDHMLAVGDKVFKAGVLDFLNQRA